MPDYQRDLDEMAQRRREEDAADFAYTRQWGFPRYQSERERPAIQAQNNALMFLDTLPGHAQNALAALQRGHEYVRDNPITVDDISAYLGRKYAEIPVDQNYPQNAIMYQMSRGLVDYVGNNLQRQPLLGAGNPRRNSLASNY